MNDDIRPVAPGTPGIDIPPQPGGISIPPQPETLQPGTPDPALVEDLASPTFPPEPAPDLSDSDPSSGSPEVEASDPIAPDTAEDVGEVALGTRQIPVTEQPVNELPEPTTQISGVSSGITTPEMEPSPSVGASSEQREEESPELTSSANDSDTQITPEPELDSTTPEATDSTDEEEPLLPAVGTPDQPNDEKAELTDMAASTQEDVGEAINGDAEKDSGTVETDPEIVAAADKAEKKLRDGLPDDLTDEEQAAVDSMVEKVRTKAEAEARADKERSPEALVTNRLEAIKKKLEEAGLTEDAELFGGQIERFKKVIDAAAEIMNDPAERELFERSLQGNPDQTRLYYLLSKKGFEEPSLVSVVPLSVDEGKGRRRDRSGTWYDPEDIEGYAEQIEECGGLQPVLSDEAISIVLEESGIKGVDETLESLKTKKSRPGLGLAQSYYYGNLETSGNVLLANRTPGDQLMAYGMQTFEGRLEKSLRLNLNPRFVISAALRRLEATDK